MTVDHESFMRQALVQAQRAFDVDEVPVGAVVVMHGKIIAKAYNPALMSDFFKAKR